MKVKDLIEKLKALDPELPVVVAGKESGYNDADSVYTVEIDRDANSPDEWWRGKHGEIHRWFDREEGPRGETAVLIEE